ncbi:MAG: adenylate/guanylate cyclase domain-containing protein [Pseudomonadota bacterium]
MEAWISKLRLWTGLALATYVIQHLVNHAFGIISIEAAETYRLAISTIFQSLPALILLYASLMFHAAIALRSIYRRATLRMSLWQWIQLLLGLSILPLVTGHIIGNRGAAMLGDVDPDYYYVVTSMLLDPALIAKLGLLILVIWIHMAIGLHFWLRLKKHYSRYLPYLYAAVVLLPALAYVGAFRMMQQATGWIDDRQRLKQIYSGLASMDPSDLSLLRGLEMPLLAGMAVILAMVLVARQVRLWIQASRGTYQITCEDGRKIRSLAGMSLLEALRHARIPHASVCGGRGRCTTCRVRIRSGLEHLPVPEKLEARALERINAGDDVRLACQLHPSTDLAITPLVLANQPLGTTLHGGGVQGHEEYVVAMFVDMRGSTSLGERVLAYDVVFILNRFFTALSGALAESHGHYAQFAGDGLMALYGLEADRKETACSDALEGAREMFQRIDKLNTQLQAEFGESIKMGIGIHGGEAIVGTMGPPKTPLLTAVGDNINIAARLESQTKTLGCDLIVSVETLERESIAYPEASTKLVEVRGRDNEVLVCSLPSEQIPLGKNN